MMLMQHFHTTNSNTLGQRIYAHMQRSMSQTNKSVICAALMSVCSQQQLDKDVLSCCVGNKEILQNFG
jgi:hypothetical protein